MSLRIDAPPPSSATPWRADELSMPPTPDDGETARDDDRAADKGQPGSRDSHLTDTPAQPAPNLVVIRSSKGLRQLTSELREPKRTQPVIGLDADSSGTAPVVAPARLRDMLDPRVRIYFIAPAMRVRLAQRVGANLVPTHGIRIWWPGLKPDSDPQDHPLVTVREDENATLEAFSIALDRSRPTLRSLHAQLDATSRQLTETQQELRSTQRKFEDAKRAAAVAVAERSEIKKRLAAVKALGTEKLEVLASMDDEESMHFSIFTEWLHGLTAADRESHPLGEYVFGPRFLAAVQANRTAAPMNRVARVCAMIACGRVERLAGLEAHPLPAGAVQTGKRHKNEREDGAKGWLCKLGAGPRAKRVVYWTHPGRRVEFDSVLGHDEVGRM
jgi:hypothetical protein